MRAYTIKRKGKTIFQNIIINESLKFSDESIYVGFLFFRKKDAKKYLDTFDYKQYYEVVGVTIDKSNEDNRFTRKETKE